MSLIVHCVESAPFAENSYIVHRPGSRQAVVVDPGFEPEPILAYLAENKLALAAILLPILSIMRSWPSRSSW